ncbi:biotin--[acetyl-CoA-carboxylase] ligase [Terriglobus roseus]|uniref:BirA family transcriptional regulator, biotin operon repressor / biotin-[acetyl-CoA-carboxylase] ligase n=1 Tax=Terriglobus roseus TaxID=392734 RepID=A0A1G7LS34_9BACT|nr:biotin--[acetyl-CoA-carboxylase] ligase [Terriglobus roseus]SDF52211.1 BirA family transcriptional regulator, biotin operon repressor / biotin-[acetyl-CoA-carboxylase] ligase [Terriglobus roseus]
MSGFDLQAVNDALQGTIFHGKVQHFTTIGSTNVQALADAQAGAQSGQVYIADEQTAGRGRGGHTWHSEPDRGLYLTMLVRPALQSSDVLKLSMITALAAVEAIAEVTASRITDIRWPNDLVIGANPARKAGGILTEAVSTPSGELRHAAIGIGINLNQLEFPKELAAVATSLRRELGASVSREELAIALLSQMDKEFRQLDQNGSEVFDRMERKSTWVRGKRVHVAEEEGYTGKTAGLTTEGLLRIHCDDGTERVVRHGGVREL